MAACDPQTLLDTNPCLVQLTDYQLDVLITQMLCNLKNYLESGTEMTCDIQTLIDDASCFMTLDKFRLKVLQAQLLCDISQLA